MKIKVLRTSSVTLPKVIKKGEWIDLRNADAVVLKAPFAKQLQRKKKNYEELYRYRKVEFDNQLVSLGVAMKLPKGYEAHVVARSSLYNKYGVILSNAIGIIDNSYQGNDDIWKANLIAFRDTEIPADTRICQFRIELSQKATMWQKIKWLFTSKIKIVETDHLDATARGGFGSTDKK